MYILYTVGIGLVIINTVLIVLIVFEHQKSKKSTSSNETQKPKIISRSIESGENGAGEETDGETGDGSEDETDDEKDDEKEKSPESTKMGTGLLVGIIVGSIVALIVLGLGGYFSYIQYQQYQLDKFRQEYRKSGNISPRNIRPLEQDKIILEENKRLDRNE